MQECLPALCNATSQILILLLHPNLTWYEFFFHKVKLAYKVFRLREITQILILNHMSNSIALRNCSAIFVVTEFLYPPPL